MFNIIGLNNLINRILGLDLLKLPRSLILLGPYGSGKSLIIDYISNKYNLPILDITNDLTLTTINEIILDPMPLIYKIHTQMISIKDLQTILKILENPPECKFLILEVNSMNSILPMIANRCLVWLLDNYSKEELSLFGSNLDLLDLVLTPGQMIRYSSSDVSSIRSFVNSILTKISQANVANILSIPNRLTFNEESDKIDLDLFSLILLEEAKALTTIDSNFKSYNLVVELIEKLNYPKVNKQAAIEHFLMEMKLNS